MPKREDISSILVIGSGPIVIGQACEFDYSGTQAVKALKEEGYRVILINSNPATIMTDPNLADRTYIEPITPEFVEKIIARERPDAVLPTIGGQTALNVTIELDEAGVFDRYGVELIGAQVGAIKAAEDRALFKEAVARCGLESARSYVVTTMEQARRALKEIGLPLIIRPSRTLGGSGGSIIEKLSEFEEKIRWGFDCSPTHEILVEESLTGWKEVELEVMRDRNDNGVVICSIENLDPMGLHTGDSITVAPIQTLTDKEYQHLRTSALRLMNEIGVETGGSNVQFAVCPKTGRQIVIELNPRVSRSSALASKATGFPIAKIAAKLAVGYSLDEIVNDITKKTPACFEPSIDYVVVKIPRFTFEKFEGADRTLGTQMKSVGEVMSIARTFPEALQKACRSLEVDRSGLLGGEESKIKSVQEALDLCKIQTPERAFLSARALELGAAVEDVCASTQYDPWFVWEMKKIIDLEASLLGSHLDELSKEDLFKAKSLGTSDQRLAELIGGKESQVRARRHDLGLRPVFKRVDTCAGEFESFTPYLYSTYECCGDVPSICEKQRIMILGGGPNRIGQGLEFDYCCVHASFALREAGYQSVMVNCNPETVSTDYDTSDVLYFEPLTLEDVLEIVHVENPSGVIVQYGGQTPLKLAADLKESGVPIIGTSPEAIELSEDREKFRDVILELGLKQAESGLARNEAQALDVAERIGFPLVVRPSFVLGGRAMAIVHTEQELRSYIKNSVLVSFDRPVLLDRFLDKAAEVDVDAVSDGQDVVIAGIVEHIERAGIHSGDSCFMMPSQTLKESVLVEIERSTKALAKALGVKGLMNIQFAVLRDDVYVLEVNPRASRSVPFVSKVVGIPWAKVGARVMAGETLAELHAKGCYGPILNYAHYLEAILSVKHVAVKESVFPFVKFRGVDTVLGPEMRSTGEVMGLDYSAAGGFLRAQLGAGNPLPREGTVFLSLKDEDKEDSVSLASRLIELGFSLMATQGTAAFLASHGVFVRKINKVRDGSPHIVDALKDERVNMVINSPEGTGPLLDSRSIRSTAVEMNIPLFTTMAAAQSAVGAMELQSDGRQLQVRCLQEYLSEMYTHHE